MRAVLGGAPVSSPSVEPRRRGGAACLRLCPVRPSSLVDVVEPPVCVSDGRTYAGHCAVRLAACMTGVSLHVLHDGPCDELSGSGANDGIAFHDYMTLYVRLPSL